MQNESTNHVTKNAPLTTGALIVGALSAGYLAGRWILKRRTSRGASAPTPVWSSSAPPSPTMPNAHSATTTTGNPADEPTHAAEERVEAPSRIDESSQSATTSCSAAGEADPIEPKPATFVVDVQSDQIVVHGDDSAGVRWRTLRDALIDARGHSADAGGKLYPNTTIRDVQQVAALWSSWLAAHPEALPDDSLAARVMRVRWAATENLIAAALKECAPSDAYAGNDRFWLHDLHDLAYTIATHQLAANRKGALEIVAERLGDLAAMTTDAASERSDALGEGQANIVSSAARATIGALSQVSRAVSTPVVLGTLLMFGGAAVLTAKD